METARQEASLGSFDVLVAGVHEDLGALLEAAASLRRRHPGLKVVLADYEEAPMVAGVMPLGVEVIVVTKEQAELGRALLLQQGGLLVGGSAGRAAFVAFTMAARIEVSQLIETFITCLRREQASPSWQPTSVHPCSPSEPRSNCSESNFWTFHNDMQEANLGVCSRKS